MRRATVFLTLLLLVACSGEDSRPLSEKGERLYPIRGRIVSRNASDNSVKLDHEAIPGYMEAMTMDYGVRGAEVASLPADGGRIEARLHVTDRAYWITDVKPVK